MADKHGALADIVDCIVWEASDCNNKTVDKHRALAN